jgi:hypothetical protein
VSVLSSRGADGKRAIILSQARLLLRGSALENLHWSIPLQIRCGASSTPRSALLAEDAWSISAGQRLVHEVGMSSSLYLCLAN